MTQATRHLVVEPLVAELKDLRESGIARADLSRLPNMDAAITQYFPGVAPIHRRGRIQELLKAAAATMVEPAKTGVGLALGLDPKTDLLNSKARREAFARAFHSSPETVRRPGNLEDRVLKQLADAIEGLVQASPAPLVEGPPVDRPARSARPQEDLFVGALAPAQFRTSHSPAAYRDLIGALETGARRIDSFPKRLSVVFKGDRAIRRIAEQRFGRGSSMIEPYVEEHLLRRRTFHENLQAGMIVREIYVADDLGAYLLEGRHGRGVRLDADDLEESVELWRTCLETFSQNYLVAFTGERIPFKYEVIDSRVVVMHEAISGNDRDRLNAFAMENEEIARTFARDFELVWERTPPGDRTLSRTLQFIDQIALARSMRHVAP